jgi:hypothetical protein
MSCQKNTRWGRFLEKDVINWKAEIKRSAVSCVTTQQDTTLVPHTRNTNKEKT